MLVVCRKVLDVIANEVKQSHCLDCFVAFAPRNDRASVRLCDDTLQVCVIFHCRKDAVPYLRTEKSYFEV